MPLNRVFVLCLLCIPVAVSSFPRAQQLRRTASLLKVARAPDVPGQDAANDAVRESKAGQAAEDFEDMQKPGYQGKSSKTNAEVVGVPEDVETDPEAMKKVDPQGMATSHAHNYWTATTTNILEAMLTVVSAILFTALFACCYKTYKEDPPALLQRSPQHNPELLDAGEWRYGLCDCLSGSKFLCLLSCCCPALRWADTMRMAGFYTFWVGVLLFACLSTLSHLTAGLTGLLLVCLATMKRQEIKGLFQIERGTCLSFFKDCCIWCWCPCCAIIQEARQLEEAYAVQHRVVQEIPQIALRAK